MMQRCWKNPVWDTFVEEKRLKQWTWRNFLKLESKKYMDEKTKTSPLLRYIQHRCRGEKCSCYDKLMKQNEDMFLKAIAWRTGTPFTRKFCPFHEEKTKFNRGHVECFHTGVQWETPREPFAENTRPIALSNLLRRFYEMGLLRTWTKGNSSWIRLHPNQAGFRRGYSTITHILLSDEMSRTGSPISAFLDLKAAYDTVTWDLLLKKLKNKSIPEIELKSIHSLMTTPARLLLSVNKKTIDTPIRKRRGILQGSILLEQSLKNLKNRRTDTQL
eukprot:Sdes_comp20243_c0_seq1m13670